MRRLNKILKQISEDPLFDNKDWFALQSDLKKITRWKHLEPILDRLPQQYMRRIASYLIKNFRLKGLDTVSKLEFCYYHALEDHRMSEEENQKLRAQIENLNDEILQESKRSKKYKRQIKKLKAELDSWENPKLKSFEEIIKSLMKG